MTLYDDFILDPPSSQKPSESGSLLEQDSNRARTGGGPQDRGEYVPRVLHGDNVFYQVQREKPVHRTIAYLFAEGKNATEVCEITGYGHFAISNLQKQPWFERMVLELMHQAGGNRVQSFLDEKVMPALECLAGVVEDSEASNRDKISAANSILDRKFGKPNQPMTVDDKRVDPKDLSDDELARIARSSSTRTASTPNSTK